MSAPFTTRPLELTPDRDVYTVSRLNRAARALLEGGFPMLWVEGELSNLARPSSGHLYFSLKDKSSRVRCAMFQQRNSQLPFTPRDGMQVLVRARVSLYESRGEFQLIVESMEEAGEGALRRQFEVLKKRLSDAGLFAEEHKRKPPAVPRRVGVVTSPTGAAIRDVLKILGRRFPAVPVLIYPVPVQGAGAAAEIARAIELASERVDCDVLIIARGGGTLEDLWAFNDEGVARAIFGCAVPVISGVGHETDVSIADFAADRRAPTPSGAAELAVPDREELLGSLATSTARLQGALRVQMRHGTATMAQLEKRLRRCHPGQYLRQRGQRLDELEQRLARRQRNLVAGKRGRYAETRAHLLRHSPSHRIRHCVERARSLETRLAATARAHLRASGERLEASSGKLHALSPLATLERGYAIVTRSDTGTVVRASRQLEVGDRVRARLGEGSFTAEVRGKTKEPS